MSMNYAGVNGYCPSCGVQSLCLDLNTHELFCVNQVCDDQSAITQIVNDPETQHVVELEQVDFTIRHPLIERLDDDLFHCRLYKELKGLSGPPHKPGRYRVYGDALDARWERL